MAIIENTGVSALFEIAAGDIERVKKLTEAVRQSVHAAISDERELQQPDSTPEDADTEVVPASVE